MKHLLLFLFSMLPLSLVAQNNTGNPCNAIESSQFDFWIGEWNLTYNDSIHASNTITKEMDGCLIYEHFEDPSQKYKGSSWSVYSTTLKKWQQTWVDNQGGYIELTGTFENNVMILKTEPSKTQTRLTVQYRMIFSDITIDHFDWSWESTQDEGKLWNVKWKIHYERKK